MTDPAREQVAIELMVHLSGYELTNRFGHMVSDVGRVLAGPVLAVVERERMGYVPALSWFHDHTGLEYGILDSTLHIYAIVCEFTSETVRTNLRTLLRNIVVSQIQAVAETLPRVRPGQVDAKHLLARHYAPSPIRVHITGRPRETVVGVPDPETVARYTGNLLKKCFDRVEIISTSVLPGLDSRP